MFHVEQNCIDVKKRIKYDTLQKHAIKKKCELEDELAIKTDWLFVNNEKTWK